MTVNSTNATETALLICGDASDNEISAQSVVGVFLTLVLCLLTQPYGSLLYRPPNRESSRFARGIYLFWRVNPLVCVAEAVAIGYGLLCIIRSAREDKALPRIIFKYPFYDKTNEHNRRWARHLHINAAALLLLRANDYPNPKTGRGGAAERLLASVLVEQRPNDVHELGPISGSAPDEATQERYSDQILAGDTGATTARWPEPGVLRRRTTLVEAGVASEDPLTRDLRKILGSNVLAREDKMVDFFTVISIMTIAIKLAFTIVPWSIRVPIFFYLCGWAFVQILLVLFHLRELDEQAMLPIILTARRQAKNMRSRWITLGTVVFTIVPCFYLAYQVSFESGIVAMHQSEMDGWSAWWTQIPLILLQLVVYFVIPIAPFVLTFAITFGVFRAEKIWSGLISFILVSAGLLVLEIRIFTSSGGVDGVFRAVGAICLMLVFIILLLLLPQEGRYGTSPPMDYVAVIISLVLTGYTFMLFLFSYDPKGTYKPSWLEILG